jgi:tetratricopeptide (TPR) repeat protein
VSRILRLFVLASLLSVPATAWAGFIRGQVRYENGEPAHDVIIRLRSDMIAFQTELQTDAQGKFNFDGLPLSTFHLTIEGQGFRPYESHIDISMSKMAYEQITLKLNKEPQSQIVPPEGPNSRISAQEAAMPDAARKEYAKGRELLLQVKAAHDSIPHFRKAIDLYPSNPDAYVLLAMAYMQDGNPKDARSVLEKNVEANPNSADAHITLGVLLNQDRNFPEAEKTLSRGLQLNPDIPEGHYELAKSYWALGRWQEAEPHAQKAVALKPDMAQPHVILGNIAFLRKHDPQTALKEFQEYLRLDPNGPMAQGTQQMITKIQESLKSSN